MAFKNDTFTNLEEQPHQQEEETSDIPKPYQNFQNYASTEDTSRTTKQSSKPTSTPTVKVRLYSLLFFLFVHDMIDDFD